MLLSGLLDGPYPTGGPPPRALPLVAGWGAAAMRLGIRGTALVMPYVEGLGRLETRTRARGRGAVYPWVAAAIREATRQAQLAGLANVYPAILGTGATRDTLVLRGTVTSLGVRPLLVDDSDEAILVAIALGTM